jgi:hypothetical protein
MLVAHVDRDYQELGCVGVEWTDREVSSYFGEDFLEDYPNDKTRFRCKDDDGIVYFGGWLLNDDWCAVQQTVLSWGMYDSGCTTIEVHVGDEWKQEIG